MLIKQMAKPMFAQMAGSAFSMITGVELGEAGLVGARPEGFKEASNDKPVETGKFVNRVSNLPWPDADRVEHWWQEKQSDFQPGERFLSGRSITRENCLWVLKNRNQRDRQAAALELALRHPEAQYINTRVFGPWQQKAFCNPKS